MLFAASFSCQTITMIASRASNMRVAHRARSCSIVCKMSSTDRIKAVAASVATTAGA